MMIRPTCCSLGCSCLFASSLAMSSLLVKVTLSVDTRDTRGSSRLGSRSSRVSLCTVDGKRRHEHLSNFTLTELITELLDKYKGVKNYQETRASEIRSEAEKRAFAIQTNQEHIVKKAFDRLTKRLDAQEEIIRESEECIEKLNDKLTLCTKGEQWKIYREIKKHQKIISAAEARIEDEEDKEELIRKETKTLLDVYRKNQSLFRAVSEPNLFQSNFEHKEKPIAFEEYTDRVSEQQVESSLSDYQVESSSAMNRNQQFTEYEYNYDDDESSTVIQAIRISQGDDETDSYHPKAHAQNDGNSRDAWSTLEPSGGYVQKESEPVRNKSDWRMTNEVIYSAKSNEVQSFPEDEWSKLFADREQIDYHHGQNDVRSFPEDEWSKLFEKEQINYESQPDEFRSISENDRSKMFDKEQIEYRNESNNRVRSSVTWTPQRNQTESSDDTEWRQIEADLVEREEQQWDETVNTDDSDDEKEQVYEVNAHPSDDLHFQSHGISDNHVVKNIPQPNKAWDSEGTSGVKTRHEYKVSSEADVDPWDKIQFKKEREKCFSGPVQLPPTQDRFSPDNVVTEDYQDDYIDEFDQDNFDRGNGEILSPRRLDPGRFSEFTKSSHIPEPVKQHIPEPVKQQPSRQRSQDKTTNSTQQYNGFQKFERQNDVRIVESSNYVPEEMNTRPKNLSYDPLEPLRKNRNVYDRHLSVEEEEWETKHLSPKRLDETKRFNFVNENVENTDIKHNVYIEEKRYRPAKSFGSRNSASEEKQADRNERGKNNSTFTGAQYNNSINSHEGHKDRLNDPLDTRSSPISERQNEMHVERSPALRKLVKQDEILEEPIRRVTTRTSVENSPSWEDLGSQTSRRDSGVRNEQGSETISDKNVGRLDLKRWSSEIERNRSSEAKTSQPLNGREEEQTKSLTSFKRNSLRASQDAYQDEVVIIARNQSPKKVGDVYILESKNDNFSQERIVSTSFKYKGKVNFSDEDGNSVNKKTASSPTRIRQYKETVIIEDDQSTMSQDNQYMNTKRVGKVNLGLWEQNTSAQYDNNGPGSSAKVRPSHDKISQSISPNDKQSTVTVNGENSSQCDSGRRLQHTNTSRTSDITAQDREHANSLREGSAHINHRSFNKNMSEDELAWEKRFSKSYERKASEDMSEEQVIQRKESDQRVPRLSEGKVDENENYFNFGKISLDQDEVRRVRNGGNKSNSRTEETYKTSNSPIDQNSINRQSSGTSFQSSLSTYAEDISQLTEEERAWEEKTSRPGRLDFSKFSQFK